MEDTKTTVAVNGHNKKTDELPAGWKLFDEYKEELKNENRFFPNEKYVRLFDAIFNEPTNSIKIKKDHKLYRARINEKGKHYGKIKDLQARKDNPSANRASPQGISYIYLADDPDTAIAEVRANVNQTVTVATFEVKNDLKFFRLTNEAGYSGTLGDEFDSMDVSDFVLRMSLAFAEPIQSTAEMDYLPCQYFAEYCKSKKIDGVQYVSSARGLTGIKNPQHYNYVLFDEENVEFVKAAEYQVKKITYLNKELKKVILK